MPSTAAAMRIVRFSLLVRARTGLFLFFFFLFLVRRSGLYGGRRICIELVGGARRGGSSSDDDRSRASRTVGARRRFHWHWARPWLGTEAGIGSGKTHGHRLSTAHAGKRE